MNYDRDQYQTLVLKPEKFKERRVRNGTDLSREKVHSGSTFKGNLLN